MDEKKKISVYVNQSTWDRMNNYIALNYVSSYGATSQTIDEAINFYLDSPNSIKEDTTGFRNARWSEYQLYYGTEFSPLKIDPPEEENQEECAEY